MPTIINNIDVRSLYKKFNGLNVLNGINFEIKENEFISIIGPSGCGKTTLLKILGGLISTFSGEVLIKNVPVNRALENHKLGFVFQSPTLLPWRNVKKNISLPIEISGEQIDQGLIKNVLDIVGLTQFGSAYPKELSGGMQQRVSIARALVYKPSILLMDEPFGALDELTRNKMRVELLRIWQSQKSYLSNVVFVTHSLSEAVFLSDKVIVLSERPAKVKKVVDISLPHPRTEEVMFSNKFIELLACIQKELKIN